MIQGYSARINSEVLVPRNAVWVQIELKQHNVDSFARFEALVMQTPEVTECVAVGAGWITWSSLKRAPSIAISV